MKLTNWMIVVSAALAGCHAAAPPTNQAAASNAAPINYQQRISGLSGAARDGVFLRAINDAGFDCQKITKSSAHAPIDGRPAWVLQCERGKPYVGLLDAGGYLQIVPGEPEGAPAAG